MVNFTGVPRRANRRSAASLHRDRFHPSVPNEEKTKVKSEKSKRTFRADKLYMPEIQTNTKNPT
jgi:hypothetical protein